MTTALNSLIKQITDARDAATMERMSMGFPDDRIEVKSVHFEDERRGRVGDVVHPTDYVRNITDLYRQSWIIGPLDRALSLLEIYRDLIDRCEALSRLLDDAELAKIAYLAKGARENPNGY